MPNMMTYIIFVIFGALIFMLISTSFWSAKGAPSMTSLLGSILPSLEQAEQLKLEDGFKAIHVKIKPEGWLDSETILYEFHPTNEGALGRKHFSAIGKLTASPDVNDYFFLNKFENDKCYLFATKFKDGVFGYKINSWIYRVLPSSKLSNSPASTSTLVSDLFIEKEDCNTQEECSDMSPSEFTVCRDYTTGILDPFNQEAKCAEDDKEKLKEQQFTISTTDNCVYDEEECPFIDGKRDCCALADYETNKNVYKPAYDIVCGYEQTNNVWSSEARWYACTGKQDTVIKVDNTEYSCNKINWVVKSGSGVYLSNPQVKYEFGGFTEDHTDLKFILANNQNKKIENAKVGANILDSPADIDCSSGASVNDCTKLGKTYSEIGSTGNKEFNSHGLKCPSWPVDDDDFCYKAKTFDVDVEYDEDSASCSSLLGIRKSFYIDCKNADATKKDWQTCKLGAPGEYKGLGISGITNTIDISCNSKNYNINLIGPGTAGCGDAESSREYIRMSIKEDGADKGERLVYEGGYETVNSVKITVWEIDESNAPSWKAMVWARCA